MANLTTIEVLRIPGTLFPRGPYDEAADYKFLNFVESGGNGYVCLQPCTGIPVTNTAYWFKFVFRGEKGDAFTYADLTAEQKAELVRDATAAAQAAASSAQSAADDAAAALQKFNTIKAAIDALDPTSTEGSIQTLAAKQGLLESELDALGPKIDKITGNTIEYDVNNDLSGIYQGKQLKAQSSDIGNTLDQIPKYDGSNFRNKRVPVTGVDKIEFFLYPSTSSYGCLFVNANDEIVAVKSRTSSQSGDISMSVPSGAVYFIWSYSITNASIYCRLIIEQSLQIGANHVIYDPVANQSAGSVISDIERCLIEQSTSEPSYDYFLLSNGKFDTNSSYKHKAVQVSAGEVYMLISTSNTCRYAFATSTDYASGGNIPLVAGTNVITMSNADTYYRVVIPSGCSYLLFNAGSSYGARFYRMSGIETLRTSFSKTFKTNDMKMDSLFAKSKGNLVDIERCTKTRYLTYPSGGTDAATSSWAISNYILTLGKNICMSCYRANSGSIASYVVYNEDGSVNRAVRIGTSDPQKYVYQEGDYAIRFSSYISNMRANYGDTLLPYAPYDNAATSEDIETLQDEIDALGAVDMSDIANGEYTMYASNKSDYWTSKTWNSQLEYVGDNTYFQYKQPSSISGLDWRATKNLTPNMGEMLKVKAKVTNTGEYKSIFKLWVSKGQSYQNTSTHTVVYRTLEIGEVYNLDLTIDLAHLVVYYGYTDTISLWWQVDRPSDSDYGQLRFEEIEVYQMSGAQDYANFDGGDNLSQILSSIDNAFSNFEPTIPTQYVIAPNGKKFIVSADNSGNVVLIPLFPDVVHYFGNSLLNGSGFGMAASDVNHDYYHLVNAYIQTKISATLSATKSSASTFERQTTLADAKAEADLAIANCPSTAELIIVQLGDNVSSSVYSSVFEPSLDYLIKGFRGKAAMARVILVASWFGSVTNTIRKVANDNGCTFVNIVSCRGSASNSYIGAVQKYTSSSSRSLANVTSVTELTNDDSNYNYKLSVTFEVSSASYTATIYCQSYSLSGTTLSYTSDNVVVDTAGVASHPSDEGFRLIANKILYDGGFVDTEEYYQ